MPANLIAAAKRLRLKNLALVTQFNARKERHRPTTGTFAVLPGVYSWP